MKRKICIITGSRAEYGLLKPVMAAIRKHPKLRLQAIAAGMHLDKKHGSTWKEIVDDGFSISAVAMLPPSHDTGASMADAIGDGIKSMAHAFRKLKPDIILILGDRTEPLAAALAAAYMNTPIAHVHGGDKTQGGLDEPTRHAITKYAHIHLAATKTSAERIAKMGEEPWRIHTVGAPGLDTVNGTKLMTKRGLATMFGKRLADNYALVLQHPVTTESDLAGRQMTITLDAIEKAGMATFIIYPNNDAGSQAMIDAIENHPHRFRSIIAKNLDHDIYLSLMKHAAVMIGNSSSAIIESSSFKLPVVNIGMRQEGRERSINVLDATHDRKKILAAIKTAISPAFRKKAQKAKSPYGDGKAGKRIAETLAKIAIDKRLIQKKLTY